MREFIIFPYIIPERVVHPHGGPEEDYSGDFTNGG